jgi:DNA-binding FrmR family transcriptional regulator
LQGVQGDPGRSDFIACSVWRTGRKLRHRKRRRIKGQIEAIERSLESERGCLDVLQQITSCRGAMNGLLAVVLEDHIRTHLVDAEPHDEHGSGTEQLIEVVHSYFK